MSLVVYVYSFCCDFSSLVNCFGWNFQEAQGFINKSSKEIGKLKQAKKEEEAAVLMEQVKERKALLEVNIKKTAEINAHTLRLISRIGNYVHVRNPCNFLTKS